MCIQPLIWLSNLMTLEDLVVILTSMDDLDTLSHHAKDVGPYREHRPLRGDLMYPNHPLKTLSHHAKDVGPYREHRLWVVGLNLRLLL